MDRETQDERDMLERQEIAEEMTADAAQAGDVADDDGMPYGDDDAEDEQDD